MTKPTAIPVPLPGLSLEDLAPSGIGDALVQSVRQTLEALNHDGLLEPRHAALCQLCMDLAAAVAVGVTSRRASAVAMAARELREALAMLPAPEEGEVDDDFTRLADELREATLRNSGRPVSHE